MSVFDRIAAVGIAIGMLGLFIGLVGLAGDLLKTFWR